MRQALLLAVVLTACTGTPRSDEPAGRRADDALLPSPTDDTAAGSAELPADLAADEAPDLAHPDQARLTEPPKPWVSITSPHPDEIAPNPVTFQWESGNGVLKVQLFADDWPLAPAPLEASLGTFTYHFEGFNVVRHLLLEGYDAAGTTAATDELDFVPSEGYLPEPPGFNRYVVQAINDWSRYPKNGTYPYCWKDCPGSMGMIHPTAYLGEPLWDGEGSCFCTGHTLEILLDAIQRWQAGSGLTEYDPLGGLTYDTVDGGTFYQHWQGYGVTDEANSGHAFESAGIGYELLPEQMGAALPGDFANISRNNGTGHSIIFINWVVQNGEVIGLRYYGCNSKGDSHPDPTDPGNTKGNSGPSFITEKFEAYGGKVLADFTFVGHVVDPMLGY